MTLFMRLTHIIWPTDYSEPAATALEHAVAVAGWYSARVTLLHVCSGPPAEADRVRLLDEAATVRDVARPHASVEVALAEGDPEETAHLPIGLFGASTGGGAALDWRGRASSRNRRRGVARGRSRPGARGAWTRNSADAAHRRR